MRDGMHLEGLFRFLFTYFYTFAVLTFCTFSLVLIFALAMVFAEIFFLQRWDRLRTP